MAKYETPLVEPMDCSHLGCSSPAIIDLPYAGSHLCTVHFSRSVEERVRRELHRQAPRLRGGTLAIALSGGKDSAVMLTLLARLLGKRRDVRLVALTIDEGIEGYRSETIARAAELTTRLGVPHVVRTFREEIGTTTDLAAAKLPEIAPCSSCGVWRRHTLNRAARELQAVRLAVGFNLDDLAQTVLMNLARGEPHRLTQMAPHANVGTDLVPRIAPLAAIPEREVYVYARIHGIPFDHATCPYASRAVRNVFRETLWQLEEAIPGTRHALLRTRERLLEALAEVPPANPVGKCLTCGEPASHALCRSCTYLQEMTGENGSS